MKTLMKYPFLLTYVIVWLPWKLLGFLKEELENFDSWLHRKTK